MGLKQELKENNILYNDNENIGMYRLTTWQIKNMFKLEE